MNNLRTTAMAIRDARCANPKCPTRIIDYWGVDHLQFDHIIPVSKTHRIRESNNCIYKMVIAGIAPHIQLLCANCHLLKTKLDMGLGEGEKCEHFSSWDWRGMKTKFKVWASPFVIGQRSPYNFYEYGNNVKNLFIGHMPTDTIIAFESVTTWNEERCDDRIR